MNKKIRKEELLAMVYLVLARTRRAMTPEEIVREGLSIGMDIDPSQIAVTLRKAGTRQVFRCSPDTMCPGITLDGYSRLDEIGIIARERNGIVQYRAKVGR